MKKRNKYMMHASARLGAFAMLVSCAATHAPESSLMIRTAAQIEADVCADLRQPKITAEQFDTAPQWVRDLLVVMDAAWSARCKNG